MFQTFCPRKKAARTAETAQETQYCVHNFFLFYSYAHYINSQTWLFENTAGVPKGQRPQWLSMPEVTPSYSSTKIQPFRLIRFRVYFKGQTKHGS